MDTTTAPQLWSPWQTEDVHAAYDIWRDRHGPVAYDDATQCWIVVGHRAARDLLVGTGWSSDPLSSDVARRLIEEQGIVDFPFRASMLTVDPPDHTRLRDSVRDVFTPHYIADLAPGIETIAADTVDTLPSGVRFDLMTDIATPLPVAVIAEWLALEGDTTRILWEEAADLVRLLDGALDPEPSAAAIGALSALVTRFLPLAASRRDEPGDDLLSLLATDPDLELDEVVINAILLAIAGHETTANLLGNSLIRLLTDTGTGRIADRLHQVTPAVVDELLRLDGPAQAVARTALEPQDLDGHRIEARARVIVVIAAANRDPEVFDDPHSFRLDRDDATAHLALGFGRHRCLGAALTRLETEIALRRILARDPVLTGPATRRPTALLRGPQSVPMLFRGDPHDR
ncbi:cytochrome P450 [Gordonia sp. CPCC 206044]|uniref:cytochrome P450 n=1 Tax=Gordonia sp. CPCC 206044 TaxID=3140793 RepID=UPI003AF3A1F0